MSTIGGYITTTKGSEYTQKSFVGGMNLLGEDIALATDEYRVGFDLTNRYGSLDPVLQSVEDAQAPHGLKQEITTFGTFAILFVAGRAYYRAYNNDVWNEILPFAGLLSSTAPRYWTQAVPIAATNYYRIAASAQGLTGNTNADSRGNLQAIQIAGATRGNLPGLLVQDNINQPVFIFLDANGIPTVRVTQNFSQWGITFTDATNITVTNGGDKREYVPIGNCMSWVDGMLYIVSQDFSQINRSVSGRPLDFMVNVSNNLATLGARTVNGIDWPAYTQLGGGDITSTSYSVGVGGITCIRPLSTGGLFVSASGSNFSVVLDKAATAIKIFGEYTFDRNYLFEAICISDRVIIDTLGDTRFIDPSGIKSFNAIQQTLTQGNNSPFSSKIQGAFGPDTTPIVQVDGVTASILFNNYELYSVNTIFGPVIAKYDTINNCWVSFDIQQTNGAAVKAFAKIELSILRLYAITSDDKLYTLYIGPSTTSPYFRTGGICFSVMYGGNAIKIANPKIQLKLLKARAVLDKITKSGNCTCTPYADNRLALAPISKDITYEEANPKVSDPLALLDVNTQLTNLLFNASSSLQGWKYFLTFSWEIGSFVQFSTEMDDLSPNVADPVP